MARIKGFSFSEGNHKMGRVGSFSVMPGITCALADLPKRRHTPERKEEIEMNDIRLKDATRILKKNCYTLNRVSGDHYTYKNESGRPLLLVFHMKRGNSCPYPIWNKMVKKHNIKY